MGEPEQKQSAQSSYYFLYKCMGLTLYHWTLSIIFTTQQFYWYKFLSFIVITPIVKYYYIFPQAHTDIRICIQFLYSCITDIFISYLMYFISPSYLNSNYLVPCCLCLIIMYVIIECIEYIITDWKSGTDKDQFIIRWSPNWTDYLLAPIMLGPLLLVSHYVDTSNSPNFWTFPQWLLLMAIYDAVFGTTHWLSHHNPTLYKRHLRHHEYKLSELNIFATGYGDIFDALLSSLGVLATTCATIIVQKDAFWTAADGVLISTLSHSKYVSNHIQLHYMFEYDIIDIIYQHERMASHHHIHHTQLKRNLGVHAIIPDEWLEIFGQYIQHRFLTPHKDNNQQQPTLKQHIDISDDGKLGG